MFAKMVHFDSMLSPTNQDPTVSNCRDRGISKSDCQGKKGKGFTSWWRKIVMVLEKKGPEKEV